MERFGDYYEEKILPLKDLEERELYGSACYGETELKPDLFGWKITVEGKYHFEADTELEARYLLVFLELGWRRVKVPRDQERLAEVLPRLEYLKRRADELINEKMSGILSRKLRDEIRHKTYRGISQKKETKAEKSTKKMKQAV